MNNLLSYADHTSTINSGLTPDASGLHVVSGSEFLSRPMTERKMIVDPIIPEQSISMLYAQRGVGKTNVALTLAVGIASGESLLEGRWKVTTPTKVLYIDGEMPAVLLQERLKKIVGSFANPCLDNLKVLTPDIQPADIFMPNLADENGQQVIEPFLDGVSLVIVDNLSCLARNGRENDADSWITLQAWSLSLRKRNISVMFVHHSNKTGGQRGSNKKEDVMDTVVVLKRPKNYSPSDGLRCEVHYEKARGFFGKQATPFEVHMQDGEGAVIWATKDVFDDRVEKVMALHREGLSQRKISEQLGINVSTVNGIIKDNRDQDAADIDTSQEQEAL